jgi:hypothetical protein
MANEARRIPLSIPAGPDILASALTLLVRIDELPDESGAIQCGQHGVVLVEARRVCWAAASGMLPRFAELVRHDGDPRLDRAHIELLYRQSREGGVRFTDALLATGRVSEDELRAALFSHTVEAIAHLARRGPDPLGFVPHARGRYDAQFAFTTAEILACLGARTDRGLAARARAKLEETLVAETSGWAFVRSSGLSQPVVLAVAGDTPSPIGEMIEISTWATGLFDVAAVFDPEVRVASGWFDSGAIVAWRGEGVHFAARSPTRAGAVRLLDKLDSAP